MTSPMNRFSPLSDGDKLSELEGQIYDADERGAGPTSADLQPDYFDESRNADEWAAPCQQCHYTKGQHADGCPDGESIERAYCYECEHIIDEVSDHADGCPNANDDDVGYEIVKDREMGL